MNKTYQVGQHYTPQDLKYKEIFLAMRQDNRMQFRYQNALSTYNIYVTDKDGMYYIESISRRSMGKNERIESLTAVLDEKI